MPRDHGAGALNSDHFYAQVKRGWAKRPGRAGAPTAELASETENQFADHIDLRTVSKPEPLTPKTEVASSSGPTGSYGLLLRPELHIGCWQTAREHKMGVSGRSAGWLLRLGVLWAHAAHGSG